MYEWKFRCSRTTALGSRISCESWDASVVAADEAEVRAIMMEEWPGMAIHEITRGVAVDAMHEHSNDDGNCWCGAIHGIEEIDSGVCACCGGTVDD